MSENDHRFNGRKVHQLMSVTQAEFKIKGNQIHKFTSATKAVYEIQPIFLVIPNFAFVA
jgi:hypothetical protein